MAIASVEGNVQRLAQYRPFERGGLDLRAVLRDLTLAVAALEGGTVESLLACRKAFEDCWGLVVEVGELKPVIEELIDHGYAEKRPKGFALKPALLAELEQKAAKSQDNEDQAIQEWRLAVRQLSPTVTDEDLDTLSADLRDWLHLIITRHGAEAAMMLYPEEERARRFFDELNARGFESLPQRDGTLAALREQALPLFIRHPTPAQREFLANLLNTSFYMTVLTIDPAARQLVQEQVKGHTIYLDTNFLYAVLGAAGAEEVYSARRLIELSRELGFELAVTPWTMSELETSIGRSRRDIEDQSAFIRPELANTMLQTSGEKGFNRYFWQTYRDKRTKPKDFFDRLDHFEADLKRYGIKEKKDGCVAVEKQTDRIQAYASLLNSERWPWQKEWVVLEHDSMCRLLVERLRGEGHIQFSNARAWFLTYDTKLPRFAERVPDNGDEPPDLPFCISPSAWIQVIRALTPRTEDFDRTVVDLLTSPFVGYRRAIDQSVVQEVVGRMDHLEDASPEMALAVLTDSAKVKEIEAAAEGHDEEIVRRTVDAAYSAKATELQEAVAASEARAAALGAALKRAEGRASEAEKAAGQERDKVQGAEGDLQAERDAREREVSELRAEIAESHQDKDRIADDAQGRIQGLEERVDRAEHDRRRNRRIVLGVALAALGIAIAVLLPILVTHQKGGIVAAIVGGVALLLLGTRVAVGRKWGGEVLTWAAVIAAIAGVVVAVVFGASQK
jgi:hypothetical protein